MPLHKGIWPLVSEDKKYNHNPPTSKLHVAATSNEDHITNVQGMIKKKKKIQFSSIYQIFLSS